MISVTIVVKDGSRYLKTVLEALKPFEEVLIYDTGSTDNTLEIARSFSNCRIEEAPFEGFGKAHNRAAAKAKHPWILSIDADEILSTSLVEEILALRLEKDTVYSLPFQNFYRGKQVRIWDPEKHVRLYNKEKTQFTEAKIHEGVEIDEMRVIELSHCVLHYSYGSISDFLTKMERYSTLFAEQYRGKRSSSPAKALFHGIGAFWKGYLLKRGFLDGYRGLLISLYMAHTAFYKYMKLYEAKC